MSTAETIAAAINVLEADLHDGAWVYHPMSISENGVLVAANVMPPDGERITRWQRTLKAQLAILRLHHDALTNPDYDHDDTEEEIQEVYKDILDLARAILGMEAS